MKLQQQHSNSSSGWTFLLGLCKYSQLIFPLEHLYRARPANIGSSAIKLDFSFNKAKFELIANGDVKTKITLWDFGPDTKKYLELHEGIKVLKYGN